MPSTNSTPVSWCFYPLLNKKPRALENTLLSPNRKYSDKARIINFVPPGAAKNSTEMHQIESKLEDAGYTRLAQLVRLKMSFVLAKDIQKQHRQWAQRAVVLDIEARWIVQRETYLQEEARALSKSHILSEDKEQSPYGTAARLELQAYEDELEQLNQSYGEYTRLFGEVEESILPGVVTRGFQQTRKNPN